MKRIDIHTASPEYSHGFTLVEMAIVLAIIGLVLGLVLNVSSTMIDAQKRQNVRAHLNVIDVALANFVAVNKRLPCPANGTIASGVLNAGVETLVVASGLCNPTNQSNGVVPWVTLGIAEDDASDPWNARIMYRVQPALASNLKRLMDMSKCDPAAAGGAGPGGECLTPTVPCVGSASCTAPGNFLTGKGLDVWNGSPDPSNTTAWATRENNPANGTGAAYVLISAGPSGRGAYNANGGAAVQAGTVVPEGPNEAPNLNNMAIAIPSALGTTYRDAQLNDNPVPSTVAPPSVGRHFDDYLSHPTIMQVLNKAGLGPRAH